MFHPVYFLFDKFILNPFFLHNILAIKKKLIAYKFVLFGLKIRILVGYNLEIEKMQDMY